LSSGGCVTQVGGQSRREKRKGVDGHQGRVEHDGVDPDLPVKESIQNESSLEFVTAAIIVEQESGLENSSLVVTKEFGSVGVIVKHPEGSDGHYDSEDT
jgi:hypothetical protein